MVVATLVECTHQALVVIMCHVAMMYVWISLSILYSLDIYSWNGLK